MSVRVVGAVWWRMIRSPILWGIVLVLTVFRIVTTWTTMTVWPVAGADTAVSAFAIGAGLMLMTNSASLRERADGVEELLDSLPLTRAQRTASHLIAAGAVGAVVGAVTTGVQIVALSIDNISVGTISASDLGGGVLATMTLAVLGVALGIWSRSRFVAPLAGAVLFWILLQFPLNWLSLVVPSDSMTPTEMRPPTIRLAYLLAVLAVLACLGLLGAKRSPGRLIAVGAALVATVLLGSGVAGAQPAPAVEGGVIPDFEATAAATSCREVESVEFCAIPGYEPWINLWAAAVIPVLDSVPPAAVGPLAVKQESSQGLATPPPDLALFRVGTEWGRNGGEVDYRRALAGQVASWLVGYPYGNAQVGIYGCDASGQSQVIVALWLVAQVEEPVASTTDTRLVEDDQGHSEQTIIAKSDLGGIAYSAADLELATAIAKQPDASAVINDNWELLIAPTTTAATAAGLFGLTYDAGARADFEPCAP